MVSRLRFSSLWQQKPSRETSTHSPDDLAGEGGGGEPQPLWAGHCSLTLNYFKAKLFLLTYSKLCHLCGSAGSPRLCSRVRVLLTSITRPLGHQCHHPRSQKSERCWEKEGICRNPHCTCSWLNPLSCRAGASDRCCGHLLQQQVQQGCCRMNALLKHRICQGKDRGKSACQRGKGEEA